MSTTALSAALFLSSLGVVTHIDQGYSGSYYVPMLRYTGIHAIRDGARNLNDTLSVHQQTGVLVDLVSGCDIAGTLSTARHLAQAGALLSVEGPHEPNNFPITFNGQRGGSTGTWRPVAACQAALYSGIKGDALLKNYPVFHVSEGGAETDNAGMQFLTVPSGAGTIASVPAGLKLADYANVHNDVGGHVGRLIDNMPWSAADPTLNGAWDGLYAEYGRTWLKGFAGYSNADLQTLPRVTTQTGWDSVSQGGEAIQAGVLINTYLAQFARGWRYTFISQLADAEGGAQGLYRSDRTPKPSATSIHNLTTILADAGTNASPGSLNYTIANRPGTVHDLLLQKSDGTFELVVWSEQASGSNAVTVQLGQTFPIIRVYDVSKGTSPILSLGQVSSVQLALTDYSALIIEAGGGTVTPPQPQPAPPPSTLITGPTITMGPPHALKLYFAEDAYQGDALVTVAVNGTQVWEQPQPVTASKSAAQQEVFTILGYWTAPPKVTVSFTNDRYDGTAQTDRNLYLLSATYDGAKVATGTNSFTSAGSFSFTPQ